MDAGSTRPAPPPPVAPEMLEAITAPRPADAPRRCFICLTDQEPTDDPTTWVDPCPCTLEAHQDCMLSWVTDCERSNKPLQCPVCKSAIQLEGPWDPIVALNDAVVRRFTRASPYFLAASVSLSIELSLYLYGAAALWAFSGKDVALRFILGPNMTFNGRNIKGFGLTRQASTDALQLMSIGPALLLGQLLPGLGNKGFVPLASFYGIYHVLHDDRFITWPPSPQLAMAVFPYIRSVYYNLWREFVFPYEVQLNRQLQGLPPLDLQQNARAGNNRRDGDRNGEGGIMGFLQGILDALEPEDEEQRGGGAAAGVGEQIRIVHEEVDDEDGGENGEVVVELIIEEVAEDDVVLARAPGMNIRGIDDEVPQIPPQPADTDDHADAEQLPRLDAPQVLAGDQPLPAQPHEHEVPPAPPAGRPGLGSILSNISNALVSALILPGVSFAMGEALRLMLPRSWTMAPSHSFDPWFRVGSTGRHPGLLRQQWGRSLVGGCLYVVMRDAIRLYTKHRKVASMGNRRVKNVDRRRNRK